MNSKLIIFMLIFSASLFVNAQSANKVDQASYWNIEKCVTPFTWNDTVQTKVGYQYWFFDKDFIDGRTIKMSVVQPHSATHSPHKHAEDEFFFVLEGTAEFYLAGETKIGEKYSAFYCPSNLEHGIKNIGDTELKYLVIKKYDIK